MPRPFVVASRSNQYRVHYVRTSADSAASNISSDASAEIALIMLIKLVCLLIGPVKVPILVCPGRLPPYRSIAKRLAALNQAWSSAPIDTICCRLLYVSHIVLITIFDLPLYRAFISRRILDSIELITRLRISSCAKVTLSVPLQIWRV